MSWRAALVFALAGCAAMGASAPKQRAPAGVRGPALSTLITRPVPARNLYVLADELRLRPPRPLPHVIRTTSPDYPIGHTDRFQVLGEDANKYFTMTATIRYKTPHLYVYVQDGVTLDDAATRKAVQRFEDKTYPTDHRYFGTEWLPGVDGDPHITCLIADLRSASAGGYYSAEDEYPHLVNPYSNEREMIYINAANTRPGDGQFDSTLAHELQHMIHWHMHPHDNGWLNEGMSMMAEKLNGFTPEGEEGSFISSPTTQLNAWSENNDPEHYGAAYLYLLYLYDHYGAGVIRDMVADSRYTDLELVNDVLRKRHIPTTADRVFANWVVANWLDDAAVGHGVYAYSGLSNTTGEAHQAAMPFSHTEKIPPYAATYLVTRPPAGASTVRLRFTAPASTPAVSAVSSDPFWWSNRGDMSDMRLQRRVDLRHVRHATLRFQAWYDVEKSYDFAYVEASTDGGKTWSTLRGTDTTAANPTGASYGNGYTGASKGWRNERVNLSRYAGKRILLRFEYVTDDVYNGQGFLIRRLSIPEIGFHDTFSGWTAHGFLPVFENSLPLAWSVRAILYTAHGATVRSMRLSGGRGSMKIAVGKLGVTKIVVVTSSATPKTTVQSAYTLSASSG